MEYACECLRYWVETCHVDGFRFDLASVMGRTPEFRQDAPLFTAIQNCPLLSRAKLIAEPWDIGEGGYQVGNFPRHLPSGMTISAMRRDVFGSSVISRWANLPDVLPHPATCLNARAAIPAPRSIW